MQRNTRQRGAIRRVFEETEMPLNPQQVLALARRTVPQLGIATVYRTLNALTEQGWLETLDLPGQPMLYERAGKAHHHHFFCRECEQFYEIQTCPSDLKRMLPHGYVLEEHELILSGLCRQCAG